MFVNLYQKYRPRKFSEIVGQENVSTILKNSIKLNRLNNSYIFSGPKGTGKTSIAKIFAKALNCLNNNEGDACDNCEHCRLINENKTIDIVELDGASNNGVDEIRKIIDSAATPPFNLDKKVFIIDEAHMLTTQAWNALLKTIEDTPKNVIFIFASTELNKFPSTILSRCYKFYFQKLNSLELRKVLQRPIENENIKIDEESINKIIELSDGAARDALTILDQLYVYSNNNITPSVINNIFGLLDFNKIIELINNIVENKLNVLIKNIEQWENEGINFLTLCRKIIATLLEKSYLIASNDLSLLKIDANELKKINLDYNQSVNMLYIFQEYFMKIKNSSEPKLFFESCILKCLSLENTPINSVKIDDKKLKVEYQEQVKKSFNGEKNSDITLSDCVSYKELKIPSEVKKVNEVVSEKEKNVSGIDELILQVMSNHNKDSHDSVKRLIKKLSDENLEISDLFAPHLSFFSTSPNGTIIRFENELDADFFNNVLYSETNKANTIWNLIANEFDSPIMFLGIDKEKIKDFKEKHEKNKARNMSLSDVETSKIKKYWNKKVEKDDIKAKALKILGF